MIDEKDIIFNDKHEVIYKGVNLGITRENIQDYQLQTGFDSKEWILNLYNNSTPVIRDRKLNDLLNDRSC
jgi:hypothetical protein